MKYPNYVQDYINATDVPAKYRNVKYKNEIKKALKVFAAEIESSDQERSPGNRTFIANAVTPFLKELFKNKCLVEAEKTFEKIYGELNQTKSKLKAINLLKKKRIDYTITPIGKDPVYCELKVNLTFNDLAASMVEMALIKKTINKDAKTCSIHFFPSQKDVDGFNEINKKLGSPLDRIFLFRDLALNETEELHLFNYEEINNFMEFVLNQ
jgi:hypothetical protein